MKTNQVIVITGATSGIGLETYQYLKEKGNIVYSLSRRESDLKNHIVCDVTNTDDVNKAIQSIIEKEGRIDIVINAAGFGISGAIEYSDIADVKKQFDVNFFGMVNVNKEVIPYLRNNKSGKIINISSIAAIASIPFQSYYSASKSAINSYTLALANELRPYQVKVCAIMPGDCQTGFTKARNKNVDGDKEYDGRIYKSVYKMEKDETNGMPAKTLGKFIGKVALKKNVKPLYSVGFSYKLVTFLLKVLPARLANYIIYLLYAK